MTAIDPRAGDELRFGDGSTIRIDEVDGGQVYFVQWPPGVETGDPVRMQVAIFLAAVEAEATKRGGVTLLRDEEPTTEEPTTDELDRIARAILADAQRLPRGQGAACCPGWGRAVARAAWSLGARHDGAGELHGPVRPLGAKP